MIEVNRNLKALLNRNKYVAVQGREFEISPELKLCQQNFVKAWKTLPADDYLHSGDSFRFRRFALYKYSCDRDELTKLPSSSYYQSEKQNRYAGGVTRKFAPITEAQANNSFLHHLIRWDLNQLPLEMFPNVNDWLIDVHKVRISASLYEAGKPTPEGIHHDGEEFVCVHLVDRKNVAGGVSTVYNNEEEALESYTLKKFMDSMIMWDPYVMHGVTPITPHDPKMEATRDTLLLGFDPFPPSTEFF